jgi:hypothetical protein
MKESEKAHDSVVEMTMDLLAVEHILVCPLW